MYTYPTTPWCLGVFNIRGMGLLTPERTVSDTNWIRFYMFILLGFAKEKLGIRSVGKIGVYPLVI